MFKHEKQLFHPVAVERPNPQYAVLMQEQLGGGNGEMKAAMQYLSQSFRIKSWAIWKWSPRPSTSSTATT